MADIERKIAKKIYDAIEGDYTLISRLVEHIERCCRQIRIANAPRR